MRPARRSAPVSLVGSLLATALVAACTGDPIVLRVPRTGDPRPDSGSTVVALDAGSVAPDATAVGEDARAPAEDARVGAPDAEPTRDAEAPRDAGANPDATAPDVGPARDSGVAPPPPSGRPYDHASEQVHELRRVLDLRGRYGVATGGGHLVASNAQGGNAFPRETPLATTARLTIPAGATVRHALLYYSAPMFQRPAGNGQGDYTPDLGGQLDTPQDVATNGVRFAINGRDYGPFDPSMRQPTGASSVGHGTHISPLSLEFTFGTFTGIKQTVWANRLDITGLVAGQSGTVEVRVNPPEKLDLSGNDQTRNGGNPAGQTTHNLCGGAGSWSILVIYEKADLPERNLVLMDDGWARAWDYLFFHNGTWQRPKIRVDHAPMQAGAKFYTYVPSGQAAGSAFPANPTCSCGCGGTYTLRTQRGGYGLQNFWSNTHEDPPAARNDPLHRDRTNGPWYLHPGALGRPTTGNDWTLFQSGQVYTEFPNLYEGDETPTADNVQAVTNEDEPDASRDAYRGHPWNGRGTVRYHASGNAISVVEVELDPSRLTPGETTSYLYLKGDQKDVWKPQHVISMKWLLVEVPL